MSIQGSLNVIQKEDIVNKKTPNFSLSERLLSFKENQQEFLRKLGFVVQPSKNGRCINSVSLATSNGEFH